MLISRKIKGSRETARDVGPKKYVALRCILVVGILLFDSVYARDQEFGELCKALAVSDVRPVLEKLLA